MIETQNAIALFERHYFSIRKRTPASETTWKTDYLASFKKLQGEALNAESIFEAVLNTEPDTKTRKRVCMAFSALAKFAGITVDLKPYRGRYSLKRVNPRSLPTDQQIAEWRDRIDNPQWRWVFGMIATYGLRPHEIFHLDCSELGQYPGILIVGDTTKTGWREVFPFHPDWLTSWDLAGVKRPGCNAKNNRDFGHRCSVYFKRNVGLPFRLYDLRHCWARRALEYGLEVPLAAQQMGHSVTIHTEVYQAWIGRSVHTAAYERCLNRHG